MAPGCHGDTPGPLCVPRLPLPSLHMLQSNRLLHAAPALPSASLGLGTPQPAGLRASSRGGAGGAQLGVSAPQNRVPGGSQHGEAAP